MSKDKKSFDVDIDVSSQCKKEKYGIRSSIYNEETKKFLPHPSGYYLEDVPLDPLTKRCSMDYKDAEQLGYDKVDLLTNTSYDSIRSKKELLELIKQPVNWDLLQQEKIVSILPHINKHFDVINKLRPRSIEDLADVLALIRPGKIHLMDEYIKNKDVVRKKLYLRPGNDKIYFKKSHAVSYAMMIVCALNQKNNRGGIAW